MKEEYIILEGSLKCKGHCTQFSDFNKYTTKWKMGNPYELGPTKDRIFGLGMDPPILEVSVRTAVQNIGNPV